MIELMMTADRGRNDLIEFPLFRDHQSYFLMINTHNVEFNFVQGQLFKPGNIQHLDIFVTERNFTKIMQKTGQKKFFPFHYRYPFYFPKQFCAHSRSDGMGPEFGGRKGFRFFCS